jgi:hypothetical protein
MDRQLPNSETIRKELLCLERNVAFAQAHKDEWQTKYPNHLVAIHDGRLVAAEPTEELMFDALDRAGVSPKEVYFDFVPGEKTILML